MAHLPRRARVAASALALVAAGAGCGRQYARGDDIARCLGADRVATMPLGDSSETPVLSFEIPSEPLPARGLLIVTDGFAEAKTLQKDIANEARSQGHEAYLLREGNTIAHFLTRDPPARKHRERIRRCLMVP